MNNISQKQNETKFLDLLFAQRYLYSSAKRYFGWRTSIAILLAVIGPIISHNTEYSPYIGIVVIFYLLADNLLLEKIENLKKETASRIQEQFDTGVFELPWNEVVAGVKPDTETIASILSKNKNRDYSSLRDWYASDIGKIDLVSARFLCQRSNVWWDTELRKKYLLLNLSILFILTFSVIILGIFLNQTLAKFILGIIFPILPLFELLVKQINKHLSSSKEISKIKKKLDAVINSLIQNEKISNSGNLARTIQDEIFRHRRSCPMIMDCIYWLFRDGQEYQMQFNIKEKVEVFLKQKTSL